ncbi:MAG: glycosyltransferase [Thermoanaerobaculaceae bacterium]
MTERSGPCVLVLASAGSSRVMREVEAVRSLVPQVEVLLGVAEVDAWRFRGVGVETWTLGENALVFDRGLRETVRTRAFDLVVVPVGLPREGFATLPGLVRARPAPQVVVVGPAGLRVRSPVIAWVYLSMLTIVLHLPIRLAMRVARALDGLGLLGLQALARHRRRRPATLSPAPGGVCHVINSLGTGGAQRQLVEYLRRKVAAGEPTRLLVLTDYNDLFRDELSALGIPVETVYDRLRCGRLRHLLAYLFPRVALLLVLASRLRGLRPACVWSWLFLANVVAAPAARLARVPRVLTSVRNLSAWKAWPEYRHWWYRPADRGAAALSDHVVVNARALVDDYAAWTGASREKIRVVPNGIDAARFLDAPCRDVRPELGIPPDVPVVLTLGRLAAEKNHAMLLRASAALAADGVDHVVVLAGHGELEAALRRQAMDLRLGRRVVFAGKTCEPQSFYASADIFALPSRIEGMPNALMEAQLFGLPAVTSAGGGSAEVVVDGETAFVVPVGDEAAFVAALRRLLTDPALRRAMGEAAARRAGTELSLDRTVAAMDALSRTESAQARQENVQ